MENTAFCDHLIYVLQVQTCSLTCQDTTLLCHERIRSLVHGWQTMATDTSGVALKLSLYGPPSTPLGTQECRLGQLLRSYGQPVEGLETPTIVRTWPWRYLPWRHVRQRLRLTTRGKELKKKKVLFQTACSELGDKKKKRGSSAAFSPMLSEVQQLQNTHPWHTVRLRMALKHSWNAQYSGFFSWNFPNLHILGPQNVQSPPVILSLHFSTTSVGQTALVECTTFRVTGVVPGNCWLHKEISWPIKLSYQAVQNQEAASAQDVKFPGYLPAEVLTSFGCWQRPTQPAEIWVTLWQNPSTFTVQSCPLIIIKEWHLLGCDTSVSFFLSLSFSFEHIQKLFMWPGYTEVQHHVTLRPQATLVFSTFK